MHSYIPASVKWAAQLHCTCTKGCIRLSITATADIDNTLVPEDELTFREKRKLLRNRSWRPAMCFGLLGRRIVVYCISLLNCPDFQTVINDLIVSVVLS